MKNIKMDVWLLGRLVIHKKWPRVIFIIKIKIKIVKTKYIFNKMIKISKPNSQTT